MEITPLYTKKIKLTKHGAYDWHHHVFTHLGWMVLAMNRGMEEKVRLYYHSLNHFISGLTTLENELESKDGLRDIKIIKDDIITLQNKVKEMFPGINVPKSIMMGGKKTSKKASKKAKKGSKKH